ncbi:MAG: hypothetical protein JRC86_12740 [Deltaproteobacteria bacterium]|nr:hypothetical protein [Deltaproteobacteria bacterium]
MAGVWEDTDGLNLVRYGGVGALGLSSCDFIRFDVVSVNTAFNIEQEMWTAGLGRDDENIYVVKDGDTNPAATNVCVINFLACGDSNVSADQV